MAKLMKLEDIRQDIFTAIAHEVKTTKKVEMSTHLSVDLGYDSLDVTSLVGRLEARYSEFGLEIGRPEQLRTAGDFVNYVWECVRKA